MKTLYLECTMGCSGDMLLGALLELLPEPQVWLEQFHHAGIPGVRLELSPCLKCGIHATQASVHINGLLEETITHLSHSEEHHHRHLEDITSLIRSLNIPDSTKKHALAVYESLAQAECQVHNQDMKHIHFHEVGSLDAVADIIGVCLLFDTLKPDHIAASPIVTGSGTVTCAHGILPVPAPATAQLLKGIPWHSGSLPGELCTPTGAALLKHFVQHFGESPVLSVERIGIGAGHKDFPQANVLRAFWGEDAQTEGTEPQTVTELSSNIDDMTGEDLGRVVDILWQAQPLDVYMVPVQMKKNRPGIILHVLCCPEDQEQFAHLMLQHTTTAGVRCHTEERYVLQVHFTQTETIYGPIRIKHYTGYGVEKCKPEFADLAAAAERHNVSMETIRQYLF